MSILDAQPGQLTRQKIDDLTEVANSAPSWVCEAIDYGSGNARPYILQAMADRFATEIKKTKATNGTDQTFRVYSKAAANEAIKRGLFETIATYAMTRIARELATIWSYGYEMTYDGGGGQGFADDVQAFRDSGDHDRVMQRVDFLSVCSGSAGVLVQILGGRPNYQPIERDKIWICFGDTITETIKGKDRERPVDKMALDEASVVVVQTSGFDSTGNAGFVAWFGRCEMYPLGRQVSYSAKSWDMIPDVGTPDAHDYMTDGEDIANPLTLQQSEAGYESGPEYPIVLWSGLSSITMSEIMPVVDGLYKQCREIDLAASRVLLSTLKSARGVLEFNRDETAANTVPECIDEGVVQTEHGQKLIRHNGDGASSQVAMDIVDRMISHTCAAFGVPAHRVAIGTAVQMPSGIALLEANRPLTAARQQRIEANRANVSRKFTIEMALASIENGSPVAAGVTEYWEPNDEPMIEEQEKQPEQNVQATGTSRLFGARRAAQ